MSQCDQTWNILGSHRIQTKIMNKQTISRSTIVINVQICTVDPKHNNNLPKGNQQQGNLKKTFSNVIKSCRNWKQWANSRTDTSEAKTTETHLKRETHKTGRCPNRTLNKNWRRGRMAVMDWQLLWLHLKQQWVTACGGWNPKTETTEGTSPESFSTSLSNLEWITCLLKWYMQTYIQEIISQESKIRKLNQP